MWLSEQPSKLWQVAILKRGKARQSAAKRGKARERWDVANDAEWIMDTHLAILYDFHFLKKKSTHCWRNLKYVGINEILNLSGK